MQVKIFPPRLDDTQLIELADSFAHDISALENPNVKALYKLKHELDQYGEVRSLTELAAAGLSGQVALDRAELAHQVRNGHKGNASAKAFARTAAKFIATIEQRVEGRGRIEKAFANALFRQSFGNKKHFKATKQARTAFALLHALYEVTTERGTGGRQFYAIGKARQYAKGTEQRFEEWIAERLRPAG